MKDGTKSAEPVGLVCRRCGCRHFFVTHTEPIKDGAVRRRRVCRHCGAKYVSLETLTGDPAWSQFVRKKDGADGP